MPDTRNAKDCLELPPTNFSIFTLKNVTWRLYLISFTVPDCFVFHFVCIELVSLIWFLQIWVAIHVYGTMINWFTLIKKLMQTSIVIVSGSIINASTVHLNGIWHLIWRYLSKPVLGGHPVLSGHYSIPQGCLLNTGFTVFECKWFGISLVFINSVINRKLHGRLEEQNISSHVEKIFHSFAALTCEIFLNTRRDISYLNAVM